MLGLATLPPAPATAQEGAPTTTLSADGRTASGGGRTLTASAVTDLDPAAATVTVDGAGYDVTKGVYVVLCVIPPPGQKPSPCGGGADREATSGASVWISSDPPSSGAGLTTPYGPGGTFRATLTVSAAINASLDCRQVRCAIATRNDHTRGSDRSQDLLIPVTFAADRAPADPAPTTTAAPTTTSTSTTTTTAPTPPVVLSDDGRTASAGPRSVTLDRVDDLDPDRATVAVTGRGLADDAGVYLALCRLPAAVGDRPGPCLSGPTASVWWSSNPPDYGADVARPLDDGGAFSTEIEIAAVIDEDTDCRDVPCGIGLRRDDVDTADRSHDLFVPVSFATSSRPETSDPDPADDADAAAATDTDDEDDAGGSNGGVTLAGLAILVGAAIGGTVWWRRRGDATP